MFYQNANSIYSNNTRKICFRDIFFYISAIDLLGKSIIQLAITQNVEFGIRLSSEIEIIITFERNMV